MDRLCQLYKEEIDEYLTALDLADNEKEETLIMKSRSAYLYRWRRERIISLLRVAEIDAILEIDENLPCHEFEEKLLKGYNEMLSISTKGYCMVNQRDIDEIFINNYNEEWIRSWDSNMDIQLTLDYYAIITYITYY